MATKCGDISQEKKCIKHKAMMMFKAFHPHLELSTFFYVQLSTINTNGD